MESPVSVQDDEFHVKREKKSNCEQPFAITMDLGGQCLCMGEDCCQFGAVHVVGKSEFARRGAGVTGD